MSAQLPNSSRLSVLNLQILRLLNYLSVCLHLPTREVFLAWDTTNKTLQNNFLQNLPSYGNRASAGKKNNTRTQTLN